MATAGEELPVTNHHDVYPGIDPSPFYFAKSYKDKVVIISGASRGIGEEIAITYARCGAILSLLARTNEALVRVKQSILHEVPEAKIEIYAADVTDCDAIESAVMDTVKKFGRIDIVVPNAGKCDAWDKPFSQKDPKEWWKTVEVNLRGVYNLAHYTLPRLEESEGYLVVVSSVGAQSRITYSSPYSISKHALNRFVEFVTIEHPKVKSFSFHPGGIRTELALSSRRLDDLLVDAVELPAATMLQLTSGRFDWLSSRFISTNWDLDEMEKNWKNNIIDQNALINKLCIPV